DLPQVRPDDPGARVLLVPGPGADEGTPAAAGRAFRARGVAAPVRRPGRVGADHGGRPGQAVRVAAAAPRRSGQGRPGRRRGVGAGPAVTGVEAHGCRNTLSGPGKGKCSAKAYPRFCKCRQIREMRIHTVEDRLQPPTNSAGTARRASLAAPDAVHRPRDLLAGEDSLDLGWPATSENWPGRGCAVLEYLLLLERI